jgi:hypothetical protein
MLSAAIVEELEQVWVCCGWRTPITVHGPINVKSPNNTSKWQIEFNSAFKGLNGHITCLDEWPDLCTDLYLTTHNTQKIQTSIPWRDSNPHSQQASSNRPTLMPAYYIIFETWGVAKFSKKTLFIPSSNAKILEFFKFFLSYWQFSMLMKIPCMYLRETGQIYNFLNRFLHEFPFLKETCFE